jgi:peroxiredoxin
VLEVQPELDALGFGLIAVGFSPPEALAALASHLGWPLPFLSDEARTLYDRLGLGRAASGQLFTPATRAVYAAAAERGITAERPVEDIRQLGGDALAVAGEARLTFRPASPDDRPLPADLLSAARSLLP